MDEAADDVYENADFANTGLSAVALYDYQVTKSSFSIGISDCNTVYTGVPVSVPLPLPGPYFMIHHDSLSVLSHLSVLSNYGIPLSGHYLSVFP